MTAISERVLVLAGGLSHERDVSLRSGRRVAEALRDAGLRTEVRDLDATLLASLRRDPPDLVWPVMHGAAGEDGTVQDVLGLLGLPFVGSPAGSCRIAWDKPAAKAAVAMTGIDTPPSVALPHDTFRELGAAQVLDLVVSELGPDLVVKPSRGGSALGVSVVTGSQGLPEAMMTCYGYGDLALIERRIRGVEISVSVVATTSGPRVLPPVEIAPADGLYTYEARYVAGSTTFYAPARLPAAELDRAQQVALAVHQRLGLGGISRTDLIVDAEGRPWFLEVNTSPGLTETSLVPQAVQAGGDTLPSVYAALVRHALTTAPAARAAGLGLPAADRVLLTD